MQCMKSILSVCYYIHHSHNVKIKNEQSQMWTSQSSCQKPLGSKQLTLFKIIPYTYYLLRYVFNNEKWSYKREERKDNNIRHIISSFSVSLDISVYAWPISCQAFCFCFCHSTNCSQYYVHYLNLGMKFSSYLSQYCYYCKDNFLVC